MRLFSRRRGGAHCIARPKKYILLIALALTVLIAASLFLFAPERDAPIPESLYESLELVRSAQTQLLIAKSERLAAGYDYDAAIALLNGHDSPDVAAELARLQSTKTTLAAADIMNVPHIFFHSLIVDTSKAFDGDSKAAGYNQVMTTVSEFNRILQQMYERGYVLVSIHDMAQRAVRADGSVYFKAGEIMLPPGKRPFVLSVDDVCYYEYMDGDGFASRIVIDGDGKPACEMKREDGTTVTGDFDVAPLVERFIEKHPDFSYRGARGILAFTGYNGIMGYRTCPSYSDNPNYRKDVADAKAVAAALRKGGWELASHSWGHRNMKTVTMENFRRDTDRWKTEVEAIIGKTDIYIFPFGSDIGGWQPYGTDNERYQYLKSAGFDYFCNVDSSKAWVQLGSDYLRHGRRNIDGYRMYYDLINDKVDKLSDLFDVKTVFDSARPVPVPPMG